MYCAILVTGPRRGRGGRASVGGSISIALDSMTRKGVILFAVKAVSLAAIARE
jgi:hypothetical protein